MLPTRPTETDSQRGAVTQLVVRRLLWAVPLVLLSSFLVFVLVASAGDPLAHLRIDPDVPPEVIESFEQELGLGDPLVVRYAHWLGSAVRLDLGETVTGRDVRTMLWERLQVTLRMVALGLGVAVVLATIVGAIGAIRPQSFVDNAVTVGCLALVSLPLFWFGAVLKEFVALRLNDVLGRQIISTVGQADPNLTGDLLHRLGNYASHLLLPTLALSAVLAGAWSRYVRSAMIEVLSQDYITAARAKGLSSWGVLLRHGLRNALAPFVSIVAVDLAGVIGGVVILEQVFGWTGMGKMLLDGVRQSDTNVVLAWLTTTAVLVVAFNLVADVVVARLDPRIRLG